MSSSVPLRAHRHPDDRRVLPPAVAPPQRVMVTTNNPSTSFRVMLRHEVRLPCVSCEAKVLPGEIYKVLSMVGDEIVSIIHRDCERRKWDR
jgi:hypothetical protein